jgi:hypothetical protein
MFAARITLPHFSVSAVNNAPNWAGVRGKGMAAMSARRRFYSRIIQACIDLAIEPFNDLKRRPFSYTDAIHCAYRITSHELADSRYIGQSVKASVASNG